MNWRLVTPGTAYVSPSSAGPASLHRVHPHRGKPPFSFPWVPPEYQYPKGGPRFKVAASTWGAIATDSPAPRIEPGVFHGIPDLGPICLRRYTREKSTDNYFLRDWLVNLVSSSPGSVRKLNIQKAGRLNSDEELIFLMVLAARFAYIIMQGSIYVYISMYTEHLERAHVDFVLSSKFQTSHYLRYQATVFLSRHR